MEELFPSEIARLVLGYLRETKCEKSWKVFLEESLNLEEYCHLYKKGKIYPTNVNGQSLLDILSEYFILKKKDRSSAFSENTFKEKCKILLEEIVANAVEHVLQKYFPSVNYNRELKDNNFLLDVAQAVHTSKLMSDNYIGYEKKAEKSGESNTVSTNKKISTEVTSKNYESNEEQNIMDCIIIPSGEQSGLLKSGESNTVFINKNISTEITSKNFESNEEQNITDCNIVPSGEQSGLLKSGESNTVFTNKNISTEVTSQSFKSNVEPNIATCNIAPSREQSGLLRSTGVNAMSHSLNLIESSVSDSIYLHEIIKVEKDSDSYSILGNSPEKSMPFTFESQDVHLDEQFNGYTRCSRDLQSTENKSKKVIESSPVVDSTSSHNKNTDKILVSKQVSDSMEMEIIQTVKLEPNSDDNCDGNKTAGTSCTQNSSLTAQQDGKSTIEIDQTALCSTESIVGHADNLGSFKNNQSGYALQTTPFSNQPVTVNDMSFSSVPTYIVPNYSSNGSYMPNNTQYSFVINTPSAWKEATIGGFSLTIPSIHTNNLGPVITSVDSIVRNGPSSIPTDCVSNTISPILTAVHSVSSRSTSSVPGISVNAISNPILTTIDTASIGGQSVSVPAKVASFINAGSTVCTAPNSNLTTNTVIPKLHRKLIKKQTPNEKSSKRKSISIPNNANPQPQSEVKKPKMATRRKAKQN